MAHDKSPCKGEKAYRILMTVDSDAIQNQYAEASVADYILEKVTISANLDKSFRAVCSNNYLTNE